MVFLWFSYGFPIKTSMSTGRIRWSLEIGQRTASTRAARRRWLEFEVKRCHSEGLWTGWQETGSTVFHMFPQLDVVGLPENVVYLLCNWENVGTWITSRFSVWQLDETDVVFWLDISSNLPIWTPWHVDPARRVNAKVFQLSVLAAQISVALPTTPRTFVCDVACISVSFAPTRDSLAKRFHSCATHMASGQHKHLTSFDHGSVLGSQ